MSGLPFILQHTHRARQPVQGLECEFPSVGTGMGKAGPSSHPLVKPQREFSAAKEEPSKAGPGNAGSSVHFGEVRAQETPIVRAEKQRSDKIVSALVRVTVEKPPVLLKSSKSRHRAPGQGRFRL